MKKKHQHFFILIICTLFSCCQSKEDKALVLIKEELFKTLYDYDSYQPIETSVDSAAFSPYFDKDILALAARLSEEESNLETINGVVDKEMEAFEKISSYGLKTKYSSIVLDREIHEQYSKVNKAIALQKKHKETVEAMQISLANKCADMADMSPNFMGWKVTHRYRCKNRGGHFTIVNHMFVLDKNFTEILFSQDLDEEDYCKAINAIDNVVDHYFSKEVKDMYKIKLD